MKKIVLISCVSKKKLGKHPAAKLYEGSLFNYSYEYAKSLEPDHIHIISAKYGLIDYNTIIENYDVTLNNMKKEEIIDWSYKIFEELNSKYDIDVTEFIILAGKNYYQFFIDKLPLVLLPLGNLPIGKRVQWLQHEVKNSKR